MKIKISSNKLSLKKETIANLNRAELGKVQGGIKQSVTFKLCKTDFCETVIDC